MAAVSALAQPWTASYSRTFDLSWASATPEKRTVGGSTSPGSLPAVSNLVSFTGVQRRPAPTAFTATCRSRTVVDLAGRTAADLESVLGATPQEFESLISATLTKTNVWPVHLSDWSYVCAGLSFGLSYERRGRPDRSVDSPRHVADLLAGYPCGSPHGRVRGHMVACRGSAATHDRRFH